MRLFVAITLSEEVRDGLLKAIEDLKEASVRGNFTQQQNLHLTLVFIGETDKAKDAMRALDSVCAPPVELAFRGLGSFRRPGGSLFWIGAGSNPALAELYRRCYAEISKAGFTPENRAFKPHLTLGREVVIKDGFDPNKVSADIPTMRMTAEKISLMKSERLGGRLVYTEIYARALTGAKV